MGRSDLHDHLFELLARDGRLVAHLGPVVIDRTQRTTKKSGYPYAVRNKALVPRDEFEGWVMRIGVNRNPL